MSVLPRLFRAPRALSLIACAGFLPGLWACSEEGEGPARGAPGAPVGAAGRATYVDSAECRRCHTDEAEGWLDSHHDWAMAEPSPESVLADFDDALYEGGGERVRFHRDGERYLVTSREPGGEEREREVAYTFGIHPLQQFLLPGENGSLQALAVAWDVEAERWFHLAPEADAPPGDPYHWTGRYQRWNAMCADCHSTDLRRNYDLASDGYDTRYHEIDVGCQACHGPGSEHLRWAVEGVELEEHSETKGLPVRLRRGEAEPQVERCAPCHSRRRLLVDVPDPAAPFLDGHQPELLHEGSYFPDGQIQDEVYVWGSFVQSRMHAVGVACTDCHDPHSTRLLRPGDGVCLQCHVSEPPLERFPTLLPGKRYADPSHHHHPVDSEGARCVSCHMPERTYMVVDPRRDHSLRVPRPDLSVALGTPNACSACHAEEGAAWAAEALEAWFPESEHRGPHFAGALALARRGDPSAPAALMALLADEDEPAIARATAAELLGPWGEVGAGALFAALQSEEPLVRAAAAGAMRPYPEALRIQALAPLLSDEVRAVRVAAARAMAGIAAEALPEGARAAGRRAREEFLASQRASADMPWAHLNLGRFGEEEGDRSLAEREYRLALVQDPTFLPARFNLATLLNSTGRNEEAVTVLEQGLQRFPDEGELSYSLGLLLAEMGRSEEALEALVSAAKNLPARPRVHYNLGLLARDLDRPRAAEDALVHALGLVPDDLDTLYALVDLYRLEGQFALAMPFAQRLLALAEGAPWAQALVAEIEAGLTGG